jgi:predicted transcriptional regulator
MYPCESFARFALPTFRLLVAKDLIEKHNFTQTEAAKRLGITQAAISQYIHSKRGLKTTEKFDKERDMIEKAVYEIAEDIARSEKGADEISESFCKLCLIIREKGKSQ